MSTWSERDFEDWLCSKKPGRTDWVLWDVLRERGLHPSGQCSAYRQFPTSVGTADIVVCGREKVVVIELKADVARSDAAIQVLDYAHALNEALAADLNGITITPVIIAPQFEERTLRVCNYALAPRVETVVVQMHWETDWIFADTAYQDEYAWSDAVESAIAGLRGSLLKCITDDEPEHQPAAQVDEDA